MPLPPGAIVPVELHQPEPGGATLVGVFQDASGGCLATLTDEHRLMVELAGLPEGTTRVVLAAEVAGGSLSGMSGLRCAVGSGLVVLSGAAAGAATPEPVHLLGECYLREGAWWFREIGYGLAGEADLTRALGPEAAGYHLRRSATHSARAVPVPDAAVGRERAAPPDPAGRPVRGLLPMASLESARMVGERRVRGPVSLEVAVDLSYSMEQYSGLRTAALRSLGEFARREMADGDLLSSVAFAGRAAVLVPPVEVRRLGQVTDHPQGSVGEGTLLEPAIRLLVKLRGRRPVKPWGCSLMVISDGEFFDDAYRLDPIMQRTGYQDVHLVVPESADRLTTRSHRWHRRATLWRFRDADQLGLIYGTVFATMTGQRLEGR
ncbi:vWA domain-containing protein [Nonomuraea monospora]|uniref:vWA domain-containing protein n=1 Tax=Nonomuraea monospora TaxID=568818 RepID=UPI0031D1F622